MAEKDLKTCQNCKGQFLIDEEDRRFYTRIKVPDPTFCPECRAMRRYAFWNERHLFRKNDARNGKQIFSTFSQASAVKIYEHDHWWSDKWDPLEYGREYDFSRPFFEQFQELALAVPRPARSIKNPVRSDYCNQASDLKNCYLCFNGNTAEDCMYGVAFQKMRNSLDFYQCDDSELCYSIFSGAKNFEVLFAIESWNCRNSRFLLNCQDVSDCFGCVNLRHKQYYIWNVPHTKDDYFKKLKEFGLGSHKALEEVKRTVGAFWLRFPMRYTHAGTHNLNVVGEYVYRSKNVRYSYQGLELENVRYSQSLVDVADSYDYTSWGANSELIYESTSCGEDCSGVRFSFDCWPECENIDYSMHCHNSSNLFGCVGLKKKQYCILNKQYDKQSFDKLRAKIIDQMNSIPYMDKGGRVYRYGEFFPVELSPLAYNESAASDYFPMDKGKLAEIGFLLREPEVKEYPVTVAAGDLPDHINDISSDIAKEIIECSECKKAYRILPEELKFYKRFSLPLPRQCHNCRYLELIKNRSPLKWYKRECMCRGKQGVNGKGELIYKNAALPHESHKNGDPCPNLFETSYALERPEIIYCEQCYQHEIV